MVCDLGERFCEQLYVLGMEEYPLAFLFAWRFIGGYLRYGDVLLTFAVCTSVNIIDACPCADALGDYRIIHFDDMFVDDCAHGRFDPATGGRR